MDTDASQQDDAGPEKFQDQSQYLSAVAHEIRTPLSTIVALTDLMERKCGDDISESQSDYLRIMRLNGHRLAALIDDLLDLHRAQHGELRITRRETSIEDLVVDSVESIRPLLEERGQLLDMRLAISGVKMFIDGGRMSQVLLNILSNASKYSPEGSTVHIRAEAVNGNAYFTIRDEGDGFDGNTRGKVFEPYFRTAEANSSSITGSGLGLAVSRSLIELHGGVIDIVSRPTRGTVVAISLPGVEENSTPLRNTKAAAG